jgi:protocatechuate 3,4-dioxygenase beta subunit
MSDDDYERPRWQRLLLNRFVLTPLIIVVIAAGWDLYASTHDNGIVEGVVVDASGRPVDGAAVTLWTFNFTTFNETSQTKTGPDGHFTFTDNPSHHIQVSAVKPGVGVSERVPIRLYFRAQDTTLSEPLVLAGQS